MISAAKISPVEPAPHHRAPRQGARAFRIAERSSEMSFGWPETIHRHEGRRGLIVQLSNRPALAQRLEQSNELADCGKHQIEAPLVPVHLRRIRTEVAVLPAARRSS